MPHCSLGSRYYLPFSHTSFYLSLPLLPITPSPAKLYPSILFLTCPFHPILLLFPVSRCSSIMSPFLPHFHSLYLHLFFPSLPLLLSPTPHYASLPVPILSFSSHLLFVQVSHRSSIISPFLSHFLSPISPSSPSLTLLPYPNPPYLSSTLLT